jgi:L-seryl-tRNA(Ser) seleniumtransferase
MPRPTPSVVDGALARAKDLPSVDRMLRFPPIAALLAEHGHSLVTTVARDCLAELRGAALEGSLPREAIDEAALVGRIEAMLAAALAPTMRPVLNLTGTVIHTNLGRALLADQALQAIARTQASPDNLEYDLADGSRGDRDSLVAPLLCRLTGAEAATVVNNNAAAVLLTLAALAGGREVVVSRGELVEIGGAFRMPDVMLAAGARLVEVGTTNRTHLHDYERAINDRTALLLKVHTSNYAVQGFTAAVDEASLATLARSRGVALASDLGSGSLVDLSLYGLPREPLPQERLEAGCDVVTFSGDKLLGGPQAGLIVGRRDAIERIRRHPLKRALRAGKLTLAALEATLRLYLRPERLARDLPTLRLLARPVAEIRELAQALVEPTAAAVAPHHGVTVVDLMGQVGSGSLPIDRLPSSGLALAPAAGRRGGRALESLAAALRALPLPVLGRIADGKLLLDLRCLEDAAPFVAQLPRLREALVR